MNNLNISFLSKIFLLFLIYILLNYSYRAFITTAKEGDSLNYHIPLAKAYLKGTILNPADIKDAVPFMKYFPASSESVLALFLFTGVPLNLFNVLGFGLLVISCYFLGLRFGLKNNFALIFAISVNTIHGVVRWMDAQTIDIWFTIFFVLSLILLEKPQKSISYFLKLGFTLGMLIGTKYTGVPYAGVLFLFYIGCLRRYVNTSRLVVFLIPFTIFGLSWYIRNFILMQNPIFPLEFLSLKGGYTPSRVWEVILIYPSGFLGTFNAFISEYMVWFLTPFIGVGFLIYSIITRQINKFRSIHKIFLIGVSNLFIFLFLPSSNEFHIMLSVFRYSFPALICLTLSVFIMALKYKKESELAIIALVNMFTIGFPLYYNPKLLLINIPIALLIIYNHQRIVLSYKSVLRNLCVVTRQKNKRTL